VRGVFAQNLNPEFKFCTRTFWQRPSLFDPCVNLEKKHLRKRKKTTENLILRSQKKKTECKADTQNGKTTCPIRRRCHHYTENCQIAPSPSPVLTRRPAPPDDEHEKQQAKPIRPLPAVPPPNPNPPAIPETLPSSAATRPLRRLRRAPAIQVIPDSSHRAEFRPGTASHALGGRAVPDFPFFLFYLGVSYLAFFLLGWGLD
jgi:hypothetical protein